MSSRLARWFRAPRARSVPFQHPRRHLRPVEQLEDRTTPANLRLTAAFLVDGTDTPLANPVYGQNTFVQANWASEAMTGNEPAVPVRYTADFPAGYFTPTSPPVSFPADGDAVSHGIGNGTWFWWRGGWYAGTAPFTMTVTVDPDNRIAETNEADNTISFTVTPVAPTLPMKFRQPIGTTPNRDWAITNYADIDPRPRLIADYRLGQRTYDGHDAIDAGPINFAAQDAGVPITAVADGVIDQIDGGNFFDRETGFNGGQQWNAVWVNHGNGWRTVYGHLAAGSITVKVGDAVVAGRVLGLMGSAGISTGTHVHYTAYYRGAQVEAGFSPASYWIDPLPYAGDVPAFYQEVGIGSRNPFELSGELQEKPPQYTSVGVNADPNQLMYFYLQGYNLKTTDVMYFQWVRPDGTELFTQHFSPNGDFAYSTWWWYIPQGNFQSAPGTWQIVYYLNGTAPANEQGRRSFAVVSGAGAGSLRMTDSSNKAIIDGRTTAVDFGTAGVNSPSAPTRTFTVSNVAPGNTVLTLSNFQLPAGFSLVSAPASIAGGQSGTITVRMDTAIVGPKFGSLRFDTNDPDIGTFEFVLSGAVSGAVPAGAPILGAGGNPALGFAAGSPPLPLVPTATLTDTDSPSFTSLTAHLVTFGSATDRLAVRNQGSGPGQIGLTGVTALFVTYEGTPIGTVSGGVGTTPLVVNLNASATPAATRALLRNITYQNAGGPATQRKAVQFALTDDAGLTSNLLIQHVINTPNTAPVIRGDSSVAVDENTLNPPTQVSDVLRAVDADGNALTYAVVTGPAHGSVTVNADGSFAYTPAANYNGPDSFTFKANDGTADSNTATVNITVRPVNSAPVANPASLSVDEDGVVTIDLRTLVDDVETPDDALAFAVGGAANGTVALDADGFTARFAPAANYNGSASFTYTATDTGDGPSAALTRGNTVSVAVVPVNDAPTAAAGSAETAEDAAVSGQVAGTDADGDRLTFVLITGPAHGTLDFSADGSFTYTPAANYNGPDSFTFTARDGTATSAAATVSITVTPVNDAPTLQGAELSTAEDTALDGALFGFDVDGDTLTYALVTAPAHGTVTVNPDGTFTYTPAADFHGSDGFTFTANDGAADSPVGTVVVTVRPVNDAPTAAGAAVETAEDTGLTGQVAGGDVDGDGLTFAVGTGPTHGTLTLDPDTGAFTYTPAPNYNGTDSFTFTAADGTATSAPATVSITVTPVNDAPTVTGGPFALPENSPNETVVGTVAGSDVDGDALAYSITAGNTGGAFAVSSTGRITVADAAALDFELTPEFTLTIRVEDAGGLTGTATVTVRLTDVDESPAVAIDVLPGTDPNTINLKKQGKFEVAILSAAGFDARTVDVNTLRFGRTGLEESVSRHPKQGVRYRLADVNGDGRLDLVVEVEASKTGLGPADTVAVMTGKLLDGTAFSAEDEVTITGGGGRK